MASTMRPRVLIADDHSLFQAGVRGGRPELELVREATDRPIWDDGPLSCSNAIVS